MVFPRRHTGKPCGMGEYQLLDYYLLSLNQYSDYYLDRDYQGILVAMAVIS
ncbi:hypothetical protein IQE94_05990 [Synechocystis sp. PCC 7339]|uniref:hypothetical protein n=1 Tax=Synechocystis sp. PCC 7339 TaxID=2782213 RepID=UPI001CBFBFF0|nr:hypothetical protein [Synechocystis sp. PCC 7339]UAJ73818.1 hypothetical protein IQE94_05990 [Synechocystis sp. PCC 7339]